jgi:REP element-mobilizing transposase RayT
MHRTDYTADELHFAYCYHVYLRWSTHRLRPHTPLAQLNQAALHALVERFGLHVLVCESSPTEGVLTEADEARLQAKHAHAVLQFHIVLATWHRRGVFASEEARAVTAAWRGLQGPHRFALRKMSFVPHHVHIAVRLHPAECPAALVVALMTEAQKVIWDHFPEAAIQARVEHLWQPSAYVGSFGDLATPKVRKYLENWAAEQKGES